jgi:hypothetical protein
MTRPLWLCKGASDVASDFLFGCLWKIEMRTFLRDANYLVSLYLLASGKPCDPEESQRACCRITMRTSLYQVAPKHPHSKTATTREWGREEAMFSRLHTCLVFCLPRFSFTFFLLFSFFLIIIPQPSGSRPYDKINKPIPVACSGWKLHWNPNPRSECWTVSKTVTQSLLRQNTHRPAAIDDRRWGVGA